MIVLDASAVVDALVGRSPDARLVDAFTQELHAPHLLDVEVLSVLRGLERGGRLSTARAQEALEMYAALTIHRHPLAELGRRVWAMRHNVTAYDAAYLALAEGLGVPLVTCDRKLAATGHTATVLVMAPSQA